MTGGAAWPGSRCSWRSAAAATTCRDYAGNLDIMTAAAARVGELLAAHLVGSGSDRHCRPDGPAARPRLQDPAHRLDPAGRLARDGAPVHRGAGPRRRARAGRRRRRGHRGHPTATASAARRSTTGSPPSRTSRAHRRRRGRGQRRRRSRCCCCPASARSRTCGRPATRARRSRGSRPTAPRRTCRCSTSPPPATWAWRPSGSSCSRTGSARTSWPGRPGSWSTRGAAVRLRGRLGRRARSSPTPRPGSRRWSPRSAHEAQVGFHGHQNLSLGVANSVLAVQGGARQIDGALCALGAGAGNAPTEVLVATFDRLGIPTGIDVAGRAGGRRGRAPAVPRAGCRSPTASAIIQGYAGVYGSFLLHAERAAERYGVPAHEILQQGRRGRLRRRPGRHDHRHRHPPRRGGSGLTALLRCDPAAARPKSSGLCRTSAFTALTSDPTS